MLNHFALAYFQRILCGGPLGDGHHRWLDDPLSILLMFDIGGLAIAPLLDLWEYCNDPASTVQLVVATYRDFWEHRPHRTRFGTASRHR